MPFCQCQRSTNFGVMRRASHWVIAQHDLAEKMDALDARLSKFRYQKREKKKPVKNEDKSSIVKTVSPRRPLADITKIPETPEYKMPACPISSPVFSKGRSLNKECPTNNRIELQDSLQSGSSDLVDSSSMAHQQKLDKLKEMFPGHDETVLDLAVTHNCLSLEDAISKVLNAETDIKSTKKRKSEDGSDSDPSSSWKKSRKYEAIDSDVTTLSGTSTPAEKTEEEKQELINLLHQKFPQQSQESLEEILLAHHWCPDMAETALEAFGELKEEPAEEKKPKGRRGQKKPTKKKPAKTKSRQTSLDKFCQSKATAGKGGKKKKAKESGIREDCEIINLSSSESNCDERRQDTLESSSGSVEIIHSGEEEGGDGPKKPSRKLAQVLKGLNRFARDTSATPRMMRNRGVAKREEAAAAAATVVLDQSAADSDDDSEESDYHPDLTADQSSFLEAEDEETAAERTQILSFFNTAIFEELVAVPGCSKKKAEKLVTLQPFDDWFDLVKKFQDTAGLTETLIWNCKVVMEDRDELETLLTECSTISRKLQRIVGNIQDGGGGGEDQITEQPQLIDSSLQLKPYQLVGLNWLVLLHRQGVNGILADEMGLGKTIQAIAFLAHLVEQGQAGPHLIVVPSSTLDNWSREVEKWCPSLTVVRYYGSKEERSVMKAQLLDSCDYQELDVNVVITTYNLCYAREDRGLFKRLGLQYLVLDEGHMLKNMASQRYASLMRVPAQRRLLLTGTPLQNNPMELISLLAFIMPHIFSCFEDGVKRLFSTLTEHNSEKSSFARSKIEDIKVLMQPFVLRRTKLQVLKRLPQKHTEVRQCPMSERQSRQYLEVVDTMSRRLRRHDNNSQTLNSAMMQMRKMANHPLLHRNHYDDPKLRTMASLMLKERTHFDADPELIFEDMSVMSDFELHRLCAMYQHLRHLKLTPDRILDSGKFKVLDHLLKSLKEKGDRVLLFSQFTMMLDVLEEYMSLRGHLYVRLDGTTPVKERMELIDQYNRDDSILVFLISTKAGGLGINLTAANVVIIHDIDFNPYNDKQAEDRCHRVGQTRDVTVIRLISENTFEEAMLKCAENKLKLGQDITGLDKGTEDSSFDMAAMLRETLKL